jgi:hypothetical protein
MTLSFQNGLIVPSIRKVSGRSGTGKNPREKLSFPLFLA